MHTDDAAVKNRFATAGRPNAVALLNRKILVASVFVGLLIVTSCGGGYQNVTPPSQPPFQRSLAQIQIFTSGGPSIQIAGTVVLSASAVYQISPNSFANTDVTKSATWSTSDPTIATVSNGLVTGTGTGSVTISAAFGGKSGSMTVFVGLTSYITISPAGPFKLSGTTGVTFYATETFSDGSTADVSGPAFWDSSSGRVISIYPFLGGDATLVGAGTTTITATLNTGEVGTLTVTVVP
jgi:trimeric autotransporter adhesin